MKHQKNLLTIEVGSGDQQSFLLDDGLFSVKKRAPSSEQKQHSQTEEVVVIRGSITVFS